MEHMKPIGPLRMDGNVAENWRKWKQRWVLYAKASGVDSKDEETQCAVLLHTIGEEALEVYDTFTFTEAEENKIEPLVAKLEAYCAPKKNVTYERYLFFSCTQNGRPIDAFVTDLRTKAKTCEFGTLNDSLIKDRIVCGIDSQSVRERLLRNNELTLEVAINTVRAAETSKTQMESLNSLEAAAVNFVTKNQKQPPRYQPMKKRQQKQQHQQIKPCGRCGYIHKPKQCRAFGQTCHKCQGRDHFAHMCRTKGANTGHKTLNEVEQQSDTDSDEDLFLGELDSSQNDKNELFTKLTVNEEEISFKIDTGAQCNVIPEHAYEKLSKKPSLQPTNVKITAYGGVRVPIKGTCTMTIKKNSKNLDAKFFIVAVEKAQPLIGLQTCRDLELININNDVNEVKTSGTEILDEFKDVFTGLGLVNGEFHIELREDARPTIQPSRKIPLSLMPKLQKTLEKLTEMEVISKVEKATDWVNSLVIVEKKDGSLRLCLDPKDLNRAIKREHYKPPTAETISSKLNGKRVFTVIDMSNCYWHKKLDEESSYLCTFNTPFGRYKFNRMPFGICVASDVAQRMVDENFSDIPGVLAVHDDIIIAGKDTAEHDLALKQALERARSRNIKFNRSKVQLRVNQVKYLGDIVTADGFKPDPEKIKAIVEMPEPQCKQDLQRLLGMVNYLSQYIPNMSEITAPLRNLLKKNMQWVWYDEHRSAIDKLKHALTNTPVLQYFNQDKPTTIQTDASQSGIGSCLLQEGHPVIYASRSLTNAEQNYAQIEKELLAIVFACERFHQFVYGNDIIVQSDHKPLEAIMRKPLSQTPPRIQRLLIRLQKYNLTVHFVPGKLMFIADTLSRAYLNETVEGPQDLNDDIEVMIHSFITEIPASPEKLTQLKNETAKDATLQALKAQIQKGFPPHRKALRPILSPYWIVRDELSEADGLLFKGRQLLIPKAMQHSVLEMIHESHLGIEKCKARARAIVYWPGMSRDIHDTVVKCPTCLTHRHKNQKEPMIPHAIPDRPWQKLGSDVFEHKGKPYLVVVDYYSKYIETSLMRDKTAGTIVTHMKSIFARHGIPEELVSDNMPYNSKEFKRFADDWGFELITSSPTYPQSNGLSEKAVQTVKRILKKASDPYIGLMEYRNTPVTGMTYSPSQLLMSRTTRTKIPVTQELLKPKIATEVKQQLLACQHQQVHYYNQGAKPLTDLKPQEAVRLRQGKTWVPAVVNEKAETPRSYLVTTTTGQQYRRNRKDLLQTGENPPVISVPQDNDFNYTTETQKTSATPNKEQDPVQPPEQQQPNNPESTTPPRRSSRITTLPFKFKDYVMNF